MGVEPFLIASALKMVISQRLVKKLCDKCHTTFHITDPTTANTIATALAGVIDDPVGEIEFYKPVGCPHCENTGYRGRMGVHEVLMMNENLNPLILGKASVQDLDAKARELGMVTVVQDALIKAATGLTSIEESLQLI